MNFLLKCNILYRSLKNKRKHHKLAERRKKKSGITKESSEDCLKKEDFRNLYILTLIFNVTFGNHDITGTYRPYKNIIFV